jgi:hypothetical protein
MAIKTLCTVGWSVPLSDGSQPTFYVRATFPGGDRAALLLIMEKRAERLTSKLDTFPGVPTDEEMAQWWANRLQAAGNATAQAVSRVEVWRDTYSPSSSAEWTL